MFRIRNTDYRAEQLATYLASQLQYPACASSSASSIAPCSSTRRP